MLPISLAAQRVTFNGFQATVASLAGAPQGIAVDSSGNTYIADTANARVLRIAPSSQTPDCSTAACPVVGSGFITPVALAIDSSGSLYVADTATSSVQKITSTGAQTTAIQGLNQARAIAVDASGSLYVAAGNSYVEVFAPGCLSLSCETHLGTVTQASGVAVGSDGAIYIADAVGGQVVRVSAAAVQTTLATGLAAPSGLALDSFSTLYIADSGNNRVVKVPASSASVNCSSAACAVVGGPLLQPAATVVNSNGDVLIADSGHMEAVKVSADVQFGSVAIAAQSTQTLTYSLSSSDCSDASTISVLTRGAANQDFVASNGVGTCTPGSPTSFSIGVNFLPRVAGLRAGAIQLSDSSGAVQATTYLHGTGTGPEVTWSPGAQAKVTP